LIYFDDTYKQKVMQKLTDALAKGGFLVLGYYDNLPPQLPKNLEGYHAGHKIFRKNS
jgi:chemotaxis methyl-accepting protein methylase